MSARPLNCCGSTEAHLSTCETLRMYPRTPAGQRLLKSILKSRRARLAGTSAWERAIADVEEDAAALFSHD